MIRSCFSKEQTDCSPCGLEVPYNGLSFRPQESGLAYIDKVFSYNQGPSCPLVYAFTSTAAEATDTLITSCGPLPAPDSCAPACCQPCEDCQITADSVFTPSNAYGYITGITPSAAPAADDVTINGTAVTSLAASGSLYQAALPALTENPVCVCQGLPSRYFLMISAIAGWNITGSVIVEGTVNTGGCVCNFRLTSQITAPVTITGPTSFALDNVTVPCTAGGIAPTLQFTFGGILNVLNPVITMTDTTPSLAATLVLEPCITADITRRTLVKFSGSELDVPCDGTPDYPENCKPQPEQNTCGNLYEFNGLNCCRCGY